MARIVGIGHVNSPQNIDELTKMNESLKKELEALKGKEKEEKKSSKKAEE